MAPHPTATYETRDGLRFWMDYAQHGATFVAPTIRTDDPGIRIILAPGQNRGDRHFLLCHHDTRFALAQPDPSRLLDDPDIMTDLQARNPGLDLIIMDIVPEFDWQHGRQDCETIRCDTQFRDRAHQDKLLGLFCDMMSWTAKYGALAMQFGHWGKDKTPLVPGRVGFDRDLQQRLDAGDFLA